ncbi:MAG: hypothetical protein GEEBNDBF_00756 [bacterium]|nr:hypothetical protein [bacterium]
MASDQPVPRVPPLRYHSAIWGQLGLATLALLLFHLVVGLLLGGVVWLWWKALVPLQISRVLWALAATLLAGIWLAPLIDRPVQPRGRWLRVADAPQLFELLRAAWQRAGIPGTPQIDLCADASLTLAAPAGIGSALVGQPRVLRVGLGLVNELTAEELVGLLAAAASEWGCRGYGVGGFLTRLSLGLHTLGGLLGAAGCLQMLNPLYWTTAGLTQILDRSPFARHLCWQQPLYADAAGVAAVGSMIYYSGREKAALNEVIFESTAYNIVFELMEQGKRLKNLFEYYTEKKSEVEPVNISMLREGVMSTPLVRGPELSPALELPTLGQRLARVMQLPFQESFATVPARDLVANIVTWEEQLTEGLTVGLDQALRAAKDELWRESQLEIATMKSEYENRHRE